MKKIFTMAMFFVVVLSLNTMAQNDGTFIELKGHELSLLRGSCPDDALAYNVPDGGWALTSSTNQGTINYLHFDETMLDPSTVVEGFILWGIMAFFNDGWTQCIADLMTFEVKFYENDGSGQPGAVINEQVIVADAETTTDVEFGTWTVKRFTINLDDPVAFSDGFISIASTEAPTCWYLGINSEAGVANSYIFNTDGDFVQRIVSPADGDPYATGVSYCLLGAGAEQTTVVDVIVGSADHTTLATAVTAADLVGALSGAGPFTVFAPTNAAFNALPAGLLDALLADPSGDLTSVLLYHVVQASVLSTDLTDGQVITTMLGQELTVSISGGTVTLTDVSGNVSEVTAPDLTADNGVVHVVNAVLIPDLTAQSFTVTFNVDMNDVPGFDGTQPVYLSGSFGGDNNWNEPGTNPAFEMTLVAPTKSEEFLLNEDFNEGIPDSWIVESTSETTWQALSSLTIQNGPTIGPVDGEFFAMCNWTDTENQDELLITPDIDLTEYTGAYLSFSFFGNYVWSVSPNDNCDLFVLVSVDGGDWIQVWQETDHPDFTSTDVNYTWLETIVDLNEYVGSIIRIAFNYVGNDGAQFGVDMVNVVGTQGDPDPDPTDLIYTLTVENVAEGALSYKYFFGTGWGNGEFPGEENRDVVITGDVTFDDVWAVQTVGIANVLAEQALNLFPNPVRNTLFLENDAIINQVRIFDLSGRLILGQAVNANNVSFNVSEFKQGVYVMQIITENGVVARKFNVVK